MATTGSWYYLFLVKKMTGNLLQIKQKRTLIKMFISKKYAQKNKILDNSFKIK